MLRSPSVPLLIARAVVLAGIGCGPGPDLAWAQAPKAKATPGAVAKAPGAIEAMPPWLKDAPFDVAPFFAMPPAAENAAPLYIEAFAGFGADMADWLPPDRRATVEAGKTRWKQWLPTFEAHEKNPGSIPPQQADAALAAFADAIRQLDAAQSRPRCVFATGLGIDTIIPHVQVARGRLARLLVFQAARNVDRDDIPGALKAMERILRLSRDIRARGFPITEAVAVGIDAVAIDQILPTLLASRKLKPDHCDRLLKLFADHEAQALDPFRTSLVGDYVTARVVFRTYVDGLATVAGPDGKPGERRLGDPALLGTIEEMGRNFGDAELTEAARDPKKLAQVLDDFRQAAPALRARSDAQTSALLKAPATYTARLAALREVDQTHPLPPLGLLARLLTPINFQKQAAVSARDTVQIGAARCLVALRRWQMTSTKPPTDLLAVCKAARLAAVPTDPFGTGPLQMTMIRDEPVIYSVGPDGRDDHGQVEAEMSKTPNGDLVYRLPKRK